MAYGARDERTFPQKAYFWRFGNRVRRAPSSNRNHGSPKSTFWGLPGGTFWHSQTYFFDFGRLGPKRARSRTKEAFSRPSLTTQDRATPQIGTRDPSGRGRKSELFRARQGPRGKSTLGSVKNLSAHAFSEEASSRKGPRDPKVEVFTCTSLPR